MSQIMVTFKVYRYDPSKDPQPRFETFKIPYVEGMRILDLLHYVKENFDSSLAYRWECRAGQCGSCAMMINDKAGLACQTIVDPNLPEISVSPLPIFPIIKDLVVNLEKGVKKLLRVKPYVYRHYTPKHPEIIHSYQIEDIKPLRECVECWACISMCPVTRVAWDTYGGPIVMNQLAKVALDPRNVYNHILTSYLEGLNACTQCGNCKEVCPKEIDIPEKAVGRMRYIAYNKQNLVRDGHRVILESMRVNFNPLQEFSTTRSNWTQGLDVPIANKDANILYYVGCMASWREQNVARSTASLFKQAKINFTILGSEERDCGSVLFRLNDIDLAKDLALYMKNKLKDYKKLDAIVTSCAGCFRTFNVDYTEKLGVELGVPIMHASQFFSEYVKSGKLPIKHELKFPATYHDPCHLGRHVGVYEPPRNIARQIGVELKEMQGGRYKDNARCCGAGGGARSAFREIAREIAAYRIDVDMPKDVKAIIQTCPFCYFNFMDAVQMRKLPVKNVDLTEMLLYATLGTDAAKILGDDRCRMIDVLKS